MVPLINQRNGCTNTKRHGSTNHRTPLHKINIGHHSSFTIRHMIHLLQGTHVATKYQRHASTCRQHMQPHFTKKIHGPTLNKKNKSTYIDYFKRHGSANTKKHEPWFPHHGSTTYWHLMCSKQLTGIVQISIKQIMANTG